MPPAKKSDSCFSSYLDQANVEWIKSSCDPNIEQTLFPTTFKVYNYFINPKLLDYLETLAKYLENSKQIRIFYYYTQQQLNLVGFAARGLGRFARIHEKPPLTAQEKENSPKARLFHLAGRIGNSTFEEKQSRMKNGIFWR